MNIVWSCKAFDTLSPIELYSILQLRNEVFVVEQNCIFQDCDNIDQSSQHFMGWMKNKLVAYTRLIPPVISYEEMSIGRVVTSPSIRNNKIGKELMKRSIAEMQSLYGNNPIKIGAQLYLKKFYTSFGFEQVNDIYLEDGIEHIKMIRN